MKQNILKAIQNKISDNQKILNTLNIWRFKEEKIVFTNGCFDILHRGHIEYLMKSSELGSKLIIGLNTDSSVQKLKGKSRPVQDEYSRALILASLSFVDLVILFAEDTPEKIIKIIKPDVLVKGGDYNISDIVGYNTVSEYGGTVTTIPYISGLSTSNIIDKVVNQ